MLTDKEICAFAAEDARVLENAPRVDIEQAASALLQTAGVNDLCLLYYSGHGVFDASGNYYLASSDTSDNPEATAVALETLKRFLRNSRCRRKVLVLDACYAGRATDEFEKKGSALPPAVAEFESGTGTVLMMAASRTGPAKESPELGMSVYTHHFVEGLRTGDADSNGDGIITVNDLHDYLVKVVPREQRPTKTDTDQQGPSLVIGRNRKQRRLRLLRSIEKAVNTHLASGFLDERTGQTWKEFTQGFDPLEEDPAQLRRLSVLEGLLNEGRKPSEVVAAWVRSDGPIGLENDRPSGGGAAAAGKLGETGPAAGAGWWQRAGFRLLPISVAAGGLLLLLVAGAYWLVRTAGQGDETRRLLAEVLRLNGQADDLKGKLDRALEAERRAKREAENTDREKKKLTVEVGSLEAQLSSSRTEAATLRGKSHDLELKLNGTLDQWRVLDERALQVAGACRKAFEGTSEAVKRQRYEYQLGRALLAAGDAQGLDYLKGAAITLLAFRYREGVKGVISADYNKARDLYKHAIGLKDPTAMVQLARMHEKQVYKELDLVAAGKLLDMAAKLDFGPALATRGDILSDEKKAKAYGFAGKDCDRAVKDLRDAGRKGIAAAVNRLAELASKGC